MTSNQARELTNPNTRLPLRADLPPILFFDQLYKKVDEELQKLGESVSQVRRVWIAYPRKDARLFPDHDNRHGQKAADEALQMLKYDWQRSAGGSGPIPFSCTDAIGEMHKLNRRRHLNDFMHAIIHRQAYVLNDNGQENPFLTPEGQEKPYFIIVDSCIDMGTTVANLASYITHNGGIVLAVATDANFGVRDLLPRDAYFHSSPAVSKVKLSPMFTQLANRRYLQEVGRLLSQSSGAPRRASMALEHIEEVFNSYGRSLTTLTTGEARALIGGLWSERLTYRDLVDLPNQGSAR